MPPRMSPGVPGDILGGMAQDHHGRGALLPEEPGDARIEGGPNSVKDQHRRDPDASLDGGQHAPADTRALRDGAERETPLDARGPDARPEVGDVESRREPTGSDSWRHDSA